jgi:hypothetical protein
MAYTRKSTKKRRTTRRRPRRRSAASIAKSVVRRELSKNIEMKRHYQLQNEVNVSTLSQGTNWYDLSAVDTGTGPNDRIGLQIRAKGLHVAGALHNNGSTTNYVRMIVIQQHSQDALSSASDVFQQGTATGDFSDITGMKTMFYPLQKVDFKVLYHRIFKLNPAGTAGQNDESRMFRKFIKLDRTIRFENVTTEGDNVQRPRYWLGCWAAEAPDDPGLGENIELSFLSRFYFTDA